MADNLEPGEQAAAERSDAQTARLADLAREAPAPLLLYSADGELLAQNDAAARTFGSPALADLFTSPERGAGMLADACECGRSGGEAQLVTLRGDVWFFVSVWAGRDPVTGAFAVSFSADDLTERRSEERAKDEFISVVNHELRTPLTAIRGAVGLLVNDAVEGPAEKAELLQIAWENCLRLGRLVDDLLDVQRLRIGAVDLLLASLDLTSLARETMELVEPVANDAGIALRLIERTSRATVRGDPGRLVQALSNLVSNAVKHSPRGSTVTIDIDEDASVVRVTVRDEGPGVPASFVSKLFAPFSQADSSDGRGKSGVGLGLYIVRTLIEAHGGSVGYDASVTRGAAFFIELPHASESPSQERSAHDGAAL